MKLDDTDFERLIELGRSLIPALAPTWTDHNTHDPGIMLMELLAWVADAQIYSLARTRSDERRAYARLLGVEPRGPVPARGLIWPSTDASGEASRPTWAQSTPVKRDTPVTSDHPLAPTFYPTHDIQLTTARLETIVTELANGSKRDWTRANSQQGATFMPFGDKPEKGDRLVMRFRGPLFDGGSNSEHLLAVGVQIAATEPAPPAYAEEEVAKKCDPIRVRVSLRDSAGERPVDLADDTTSGLSRTGLLLLRIAGGTSPAENGVCLILESPTGNFLRSPRVQQIALNVLPVEQIEAVTEEVPQFGKNRPDQQYQLRRPGLVFPLDEKSFGVRLFEDSTWQDWTIAADLRACGPDDRRFAFETDRSVGVLSFGNGINGRLPPPGRPIQLKYRVSDGSRGNLPAGVRWEVGGIAGIFGTNVEPTYGGLNALGLPDLQAISRRRSRENRPLVSSKDLESAALSFSELGVKRALELSPGLGGHRVRGSRILVVVGVQGVDGGAPRSAESLDWLQEIRGRLAPRLPLGQRLEVIAPRYVNVGVKAKLVAAPNMNPDQVQQKAMEMLETQLATVAGRTGGGEWPFGRAVTPLAVKGWLRNVEGVARLATVELLEDGVAASGRAISLGVIGLPRLTLEPENLTVERSPKGTKR